MYHPLAAEELERHQDLLREAADESQREPPEVVVLEEIVQVDGEELEGDAQVAAEVEVFLHLHQVVLVLLVLVPQVLQNLELHQRLLVKPLLVPYHLHGHRTSRLVVVTAHHLPEATLAELVDDLEPVREMVALAHHVVAAVVVVAVVIAPASLLALHLLRADPREVHARVLQNLRPLERGQRGAVSPERSRRRDAGANVRLLLPHPLAPSRSPGRVASASSSRAVRRIPAFIVGAPPAYAAGRVSAVVRRRRVSGPGRHRGQSEREGQRLRGVPPPRNLGRGRGRGYRATTR